MTIDVLPQVEVNTKLTSELPVKSIDDLYMFKWNVTLAKNGKTYSFDFHTGLGLLNKEKPKYLNMANTLTEINVSQERDGLKTDKIPVSALARMSASKHGRWDYLLYKPSEPTKNDILQCLASDASSMMSMPTFDEWCSDFGYSNDSIKAKTIFDSVYEQTAKIKALLGDNDFNTLLSTDFDNLEESSDSPSI